VLACLTTFGQLPAAPQDQELPSAQIEDLTRELGPFEVGERQFTVALRMKRVVTDRPVVDPEFQETLASLAVRDAAGSVHYETSFPVPDISEGGFVETTAAAASSLRGRLGSGLLISYGSLPSTPLGGTSWQVLGLHDGRLVPFGKPLYLEGDLLNAGDGSQPIATSEEPNLAADLLHYRVWTGNFFAIVPLRIDWLRGSVSLAWQCQKMTPRGPRPLCQVRVEADRVPQEGDLTFVRLYDEPEDGRAAPAHVVVRRDSLVEFLAAETEVIWDEDANGVGLSVSGDIWLKLRIDDKEGWIHTQEDFTAIGLPQAG
jgi:hypothetical protein